MRRSGLSRDGLVADPRSGSPLVQSYVGLVERIILALRGEAMPAVVVCSPARGDGRTSVAANLAICAAAVGGGRVLAVDADLEHPGLSKAFGAGSKPGLAEALAGEQDWSSAVIPVKDSNLHVLPAGRGLSASIVARAGQFAQLVADWRRRFDWTIIDTPPLSASTAACMAADHASGSLLVLRAGRTRPEVLEASLARLREGKAPVLGTVLNRRRYMIPHGAYRRL